MAKFTKQAICGSFMKLLSEKPLEQVTVKDIVDDCGINRKTFYYYYQDIFELLDDVFKMNIRQLKEELPPEKYSWHDVLKAIADYLYKDKKITFHVFKSLGYEKINDILFDSFMQYLPDFIRSSADDLTINDEDLALISSYISITLSGILTKWISQGMETIPDDTVERLCRIMEGCSRLALENADRLAKEAKQS